MLKRIAALVTVLLLVGGLVNQLFGTGRYLYGKFNAKVWASRRLDAIVRSADGSFGAEFAGYVSFLRASMPNNATVVLPPGPTAYFLNDRYLMQYFLFPRDIAICQSDCTNWFADPDTYIISQGDFPPADLIPPSKRLVVFNDTLGLYVPVR